MLSWKRVFTATPMVAFLLGIVAVGYWIYIGEVDELCEIKADGTGLISLGELNFGIELTCDPIPFGIALGIFYIGGLLYLPVLLFLTSIRAFLMLVRRIRGAPQGRGNHREKTNKNAIKGRATTDQEKRWAGVFITTPIITFFLGLLGSGYFIITDKYGNYCTTKHDGSGIIRLGEELYGPNASCNPDFVKIAVLVIGSFGIMYIPVLLILSAILFSSIVTNRNKLT